ncbi:MAG: DUF1461 domain-containing protein [Aquificaceae bacterium]|jgi:integral membrane protein (TIGR01906 family)|uniref:lipoprotein intramolecular transacylase Lit n=1 Tax=Hydrogenobacter sp. Uz 6-8 TaxID=3384828 RepID=UPI000F17F22D|nr:MAG: DUF1461 domain-containing protein [Aquificota bacterium]
MALGKGFFLRAVLVALFPLFITLLLVRLAFTEAFVGFLYRKVDLPPDPMPYELRLSIAKMGLRSVLSDEGMEEFRSSGLFNQREIRHMEDVKRLLSFFFNFLYLGLPLWLVGFFAIRSKKEMGKVLFFGSLLLEAFIILVIILSAISYEWLFEAFHNLFFDPYSWRFRDEDMLLRVYPMDFWFKATLYTAFGVFCLNILLQVTGFILWRKSS